MTESKNRERSGLNFEKIVMTLTKSSGSTLAIVIAVSLVVLWSFSGLIFSYSEVWQSVINKGTTIITFIMVFVIQRAQNKDSRAIQLKLNELIAATKGASNRLVDVEELTGKELDILKSDYTELSATLKKNNRVNQSHSVDEAGKET